MTMRDKQNPAGLISLSDEEAVRQLVTGTVFDLWRIVNNLTKLRPTKRDSYRVTIFGSARAQPGTIAYTETKRVAKALTELGCDIITGGGPGLMQAANEGASEADPGDARKSVGIRVALPLNRASTRSSNRASSTRTSSPVCTISYSPPTPSSSPPAGSARCWRR